MPVRVAPRLPIVDFLERRTRTQWRVVGAAVGLILVWWALRGTARILLDRWWLDTVTAAPVWSRRTTAQLQVGFGAAAVVALVLGGSVWIVIHLARLDHGRRHRVWERYDQRVGPAHRWALVALAAYLTWHIGRAAGGQWQAWLLFWHGGDVGTSAPEIGGDIGFYLFRLPLLATASSFLRQLLLVAIALSGFGHLASGALRLPRGAQRSSTVAVTHLSVLSAMLLAVQAAHQAVVARAATATNRIGPFDGPGFTEINVTRPALVVTSLLTVALGFAVVLGSRTRRWRPVVALAALALAGHVIGLLIAPYLVERYLVAPAEAERQLWSIEHNLAATRTAYGLDRVTIEERAVREGLTSGEIASLDDPGAARIPLFGTTGLARSLQVLVGTPGTRVSDVDLLSYVVDGVPRPVYAAARNASRGDLPERGWVHEHLVYTHGDGVVALAADVVDADGRPDVGSLPELATASHAPLYFGEELDGWYAIVDTRREEFDGVRYDGGGVPVGSAFRRIVLSLAEGETEPVFTNELTGDSLLLYRRGVRERVSALAPFLTLDSDPYPVIDGDRVVWVIDAYTTSSTYPYAQFLPPGQPPSTPLARGSQNSVRASVRATVDAGDGTVRLYRTDRGDDPILSAWAKVFPGLFEDVAEMPAGVAEHVRYPSDLFAVQTWMLGRYHVTDPEQLFSGADRWSVSPASATIVGEVASGEATAVDVFVGGRLSMTRTYAPGAADNPGSTRNELAGLATAAHGPSGDLALLVPADRSLLSPAVAQGAIDADPELAQVITLLNANGSHVEFGPMSPLAVGEGLAWARPIIVIGAGEASAPRLYGVAVVSDGLVALGPDVATAFERLGQPSAE